MIRQMELKNFKCFSSNNIHFNKLSLLAGANAVGKSSLIQALLLIRQTIDNHASYTYPSDNPLKIPLNGKYCLNLGDSSQVISSNVDSEEISFKLINSTDNMTFKYQASKISQELYLEYHNDGYTPNRNISICHDEIHYLNTERLGPRLIQDMRNQSYPNTGFRGEYTGHVIEQLSEYKVPEDRRIHNKSNTVPNLNKQVEYWLDYIIPGVMINTNLYSSINTVAIQFKKRYSDTAFLNPNNIGFGISYALPIIVSGLIAKEGCLFIVENPEAHLHPSAQSRIGQFLAQVANSGVQVIIETHSEHVINGIRIAILKDLIGFNDVSINFINMPQGSKKVEVENIELNKYADLSHWPEGFLDQEQQDLRELITLRRKVSK